MPQYRIAFTGASGTGKTTLATWLAGVLGIDFNPVGARSVAAAMGLATPYQADAEGRRAEFQRNLLFAKETWELGHDAFVTDRTPFDNVVYTELHAPEANVPDALKIAFRGYARYTHVFHCPLESFQNLDVDAARYNADDWYHVDYERRLARWLNEALDRAPCGYFLHTLRSSELDARKSQILDALARTRS